MNTYDTDFDKWLTEQANNLRNHNWNSLGIDNLIEELECVNRSDKRELNSYTVVILTRLLKWQFQPDRRSGNWEASIKNSRYRIEDLFDDRPSLRPYIEQVLAKSYREAKDWAKQETGLDIFPPSCPYTTVEILDLDFLPD